MAQNRSWASGDPDIASLVRLARYSSLSRGLHIVLRDNFAMRNLIVVSAGRVFEGWGMSRLQELIEDLSERAADSDLLALLAASRERRLYNAILAKALRELIEALKQEEDLQQASILPPSNEIRVTFETIKPAKPSSIPRDMQPMFTGEVFSSIS